MSKAREAQYKNRGRSKGLESRLKGKALDSKRQREELLTGRRRAALLEINEEIMAEEGIQEKGTSKKKASDDRKEELLKWKKERDRKKQKEQEKANIKPAFVVGKANVTSNRKVPLSGEPSSSTVTAKEGPSKKGGKRLTEAPGDTKREELGRKRATSSRQPDKVQKPATRSSTRLQTVKSKETKVVKQPTKKQSTAKSSKSTNSKREITKEPSPPLPAIDKPDLPRDSVLSSAWIPGAPPTPQCSSQNAHPNFDQFFSKQLFSPFQFKGQTGGKTSAKKSQGIFTFRKEFREEDIIKHIEDDSICSDNNIEEEKMEEKEATVPARDDTDRGKSAKKGEVEGGGRKRNLKKRQNERTAKESDDEEDLETIDTGTKMGREEEPVDELPTNIRMSDTSIEAINVSVAHNNNYTNQQLEEERQSSTDPPVNVVHTQDLSPPVANIAPPTTDVTPPSEGLATDATGNDSGFDLAPFYKLHADVTQRFNELCAEWTDKLSRLEDDGEKDEDAGRPNDEVIDDIRTTVCQAKLLMRQKLKQYLELVQQAEDPTAEHKTMAEDLQGFWDMVYFQVENIYKKFSSFADMESNSWKEVVVTAPAKDGESVKPRRSKRGASKAKRGGSTTGASSAVSERLKAARAKREAERLKIREMRQAFAASKTEEEKQEEVPAPITPEKKDNIAESPSPDLISFSPAPSSLRPPTTPKFTLKTPQSASKSKTSSKKRLSSIPDVVFEFDESHESEGAFMTKLVQISASKKMIKDFDTDLIMSPARRSKRLSTRRRSELVISSISEMPNDCNNVAYLPNKALID